MACCRVTIALGACAALTGAARADDGAAGGADIAPRGTLVLEAGYAQRRAADTTTTNVRALARYSVADRLELQLGTNNVVTASTGSGAQTLDGMFLGPKVMLVDQTATRPMVSVSAVVMMPTRGDDAVASTDDAYLWAYLSKDVAGVRADLNVGANLLNYDDDPTLQEVVALSLARDLGGGVGAQLEGYALGDGGMYATHDAGIQVELTYALSARVALDVGIDIALYRDTRDTTMFAGVAFVPYLPDLRR